MPALSIPSTKPLGQASKQATSANEQARVAITCATMCRHCGDVVDYLPLCLVPRLLLFARPGDRPAIPASPPETVFACCWGAWSCFQPYGVASTKLPLPPPPLLEAQQQRFSLFAGGTSEPIVASVPACAVDARRGSGSGGTTG